MPESVTLVELRLYQDGQVVKLDTVALQRGVTGPGARLAYAAVLQAARAEARRLDPWLA